MPKAVLAARDTIHTDVTRLTNQFGKLCLLGTFASALSDLVIRSARPVRSTDRQVESSMRTAAPTHLDLQRVILSSDCNGGVAVPRDSSGIQFPCCDCGPPGY
jgi:hypothetical protein